MLRDNSKYDHFEVHTVLNKDGDETTFAVAKDRGSHIDRVLGWDEARSVYTKFKEENPEHMWWLTGAKGSGWKNIHSHLPEDENLNREKLSVPEGYVILQA